MKGVWTDSYWHLPEASEVNPWSLWSDSKTAMATAADSESVWSSVVSFLCAQEKRALCSVVNPVTPVQPADAEASFVVGMSLLSVR